MKFGVQLFGPGNLCKSDPESFFKTLLDIGYQLIEPCVWLEEVPEDAKIYPIWTIDEFTTFKSIYEKYNLKVQSCHIFTRSLDKMSNNHDFNSLISIIASKIKKLHDDFGISYFIFAGHSETTKEGCLNYSKKLIQLSQQLSSIQTDNSIRLLLHNGKEESVSKIEGKSAFEFLLDCCDGYIESQIDVGWLLYGQIDVESFLWRNKKRILSLHYKDFGRKSDNTLDEVIIGCGLIDIESCFQFARANEVCQIVDMDKCDSKSFKENMQKIRNHFNELSQTRKNTTSILSVYNIETCEVKTLHKFDRIIEAPNWLNDNNTIIYNSEGKIYKYSIVDDKEEVIQTGICNNCNNDHVLSPDNKKIAISHSEPGGWQSKIYILPITGSENPTLVTPNAPSFLHGWSPDGKELSYCAFREDDSTKKFSVDVFTINVDGGVERRLTKNACFNDGPEYQPDGNKIWFNSTRTGLMQIWKMERDGKNQTQVTFEEQNNWFAHISPDGQKVVNLAYTKDGLDANEHLPNMNVSLWLMNIDGKERSKIMDLFGGQGSINVNSWAPDSKKFAFVSYELHHK